MRRIVSWSLLLAGPALAAAWLLGWYTKDRSALLIWFYFIPTPAAALGLGLWLVWFRREGTPLVARFLVRLALVVMLLKITCVDFAWHRPGARSETSIRIVHWNTARGYRGLSNIVDSVAQDRADICLFSESPKGGVEPLARQALGLPFVVTNRDMILMSRFPMEPSSPIDLSNGLGWATRIETPRGPLEIAAVDIISHPTLNRFVPLGELARWVATRNAGAPLFVLGDFNTPRDSLAFLVLRRWLVHPYESAGWGWPYSWPMPCPVYAIDHAWVSPSVHVVDYRLKTTPWSDHRRQIMDVELPATAEAANRDAF